MNPTQFGVPIKTSKRKPTKADANAGGCVLVWKDDFWVALLWDHVQGDEYPYWMPQPLPPPGVKSEAEKAWEAWQAGHIVSTFKTAFVAGYEAAKNE